MADDGKWYAPEQRVGDTTAVPSVHEPHATVEVAGSAVPPSVAAEGTSRRRVGLVAALAAVGVLVGASAAFLLLGDDGVDGGASDAPDDGEVFLEPADEIGDDAFTDVAFVTPPVVAIDVEVPDGGVEAIGSSRGSTPGLFGGSRDEGSCDRDAIAGFLDSNPDHAGAFVDALAADPTWGSEGTTGATPDQLGGHLATLTPVLLTADTRVTNHGYRDGEPLPFQAVLQAGTAVLVDTHGVPRVRCACGNPLTTPAAVRGSVTYTGAQWATFDPTRLMVVRPAQRAISSFVLVDVTTGDRFERPAGTTGAADTLVGRGSSPPPTTEPPTTTRPPATTGPPATEVEDASAEQLEAIRRWARSSLGGTEVVGWCVDHELPPDVDPYDEDLPWCADRPRGSGDEVTTLVGDLGGLQAFWLRLVRGPDGWAVVAANFGGPPS